MLLLYTSFPAGAQLASRPTEWNLEQVWATTYKINERYKIYRITINKAKSRTEKRLIGHKAASRRRWQTNPPEDAIDKCPTA